MERLYPTVATINNRRSRALSQSLAQSALWLRRAVPLAAKEIAWAYLKRSHSL
jgi:hypothetical protein